MYQKIGLLLACLLVIISTNTFANCENSPIGYHEFAIFGANNHVYISHYPKFSSVHSYQVILEVALSSDDHNAQQKFLEHLTKNPQLEYSYSPYRPSLPSENRAKDQDDWVLPDKGHKGIVLNGDIHYEQDEKNITLDYNVKAKVINVIQNRLLLPDKQRPEKLTYILFGDRNGTYLAHYLSAPPNPGEEISDFDQLLAVSVIGNEPKYNTIYTVPERQNLKDKRLLPGENISLVDAAGKKVNVKVVSEIMLNDISTDR